MRNAVRKRAEKRRDDRVCFMVLAYVSIGSGSRYSSGSPEFE
jgi:hypothetical protein